LAQEEALWRRTKLLSAFVADATSAKWARRSRPGRRERFGARADRLGLSAPAFIEEIPIKETNDSVKKILGFYLIYLQAYPPQAGKAPG